MNIVGARVVVDRIVRFELDDGRQVERDFSLVRGPVFDRAWRTQEKFNQVKIVGGVPTWPGEVELCPDAVLRGGTRGRIPRSAIVSSGNRLLSSVPVRELVLRKSRRARTRLSR
jgi:hypothetical protein